MGIWPTAWAQETFLECHKWWFFGLALSIIGSTVNLFFPASEPPAAKQSDEKTKPAEKQKKADLTPLVKTLIVDACDIVIPGSVLGWIPASSTQVGIVMIVSTLAASGDIWAQANRA